VIKLRIIRWAELIALWGKKELHAGFQRGNLREETTWKTQAYMGG
jgi:hypothetical protein